MNNIKLVILFMTLSVCSCSTTKLTEPTFGKNSSVERHENDVIFDKDYIIGIELTNFKDRFTPTLDEIDEVKKLIRTKNIWNNVFPENTSINQYFAFVDVSNHKYIVVQIINNRNSVKVKKLLGNNWEYDFVAMLSDEFYSLSNRFRVNLEKKTLNSQL